MHPGRAIEAQEMVHRSRDEFAAQRHRHAAVRACDHRPPGGVHAFSIECRDVVFVFLRDAEIARPRPVARSSTGNRRHIDARSLVKEIRLLRGEIDLDGEVGPARPEDVGEAESQDEEGAPHTAPNCTSHAARRDKLPRPR